MQGKLQIRSFFGHSKSTLIYHLWNLTVLLGLNQPRSRSTLFIIHELPKRLDEFEYLWVSISRRPVKCLMVEQILLLLFRCLCLMHSCSAELCFPALTIMFLRQYPSSAVPSLPPSSQSPAIRCQTHPTPYTNL